LSGVPKPEFENEAGFVAPIGSMKCRATSSPDD
jgi:hypothetical protein